MKPIVNTYLVEVPGRLPLSLPRPMRLPPQPFLPSIVWCVISGLVGVTVVQLALTLASFVPLLPSPSIHPHFHLKSVLISLVLFGEGLLY